jgi:IS30 family transposase
VNKSRSVLATSGGGARGIGRLLNRAGSTISRELLRMNADAQEYRAETAAHLAAMGGGLTMSMAVQSQAIRAE